VSAPGWDQGCEELRASLAERVLFLAWVVLGPALLGDGLLWGLLEMQTLATTGAGFFGFGELVCSVMTLGSRVGADPSLCGPFCCKALPRPPHLGGGVSVLAVPCRIVRLSCRTAAGEFWATRVRRRRFLWARGFFEWVCERDLFTLVFLRSAKFAFGGRIESLVAILSSGPWRSESRTARVGRTGVVVDGCRRALPGICVWRGFLLPQRFCVTTMARMLVCGLGGVWVPESFFRRDRWDGVLSVSLCLCARRLGAGHARSGAWDKAPGLRCRVVPWGSRLDAVGCSGCGS